MLHIFIPLDNIRPIKRLGQIIEIRIDTNHERDVGLVQVDRVLVDVIAYGLLECRGSSGAALLSVLKKGIGKLGAIAVYEDCNKRGFFLGVGEPAVDGMLCMGWGA